MRIPHIAAFSVLPLLLSCSGDPGASVVLFPCPAELFHMEADVSAVAGRGEMPALVPGPAVEPSAPSIAQKSIAAVRAKIPASFFERSDEDVIVADSAADSRPLAPAVEDGFAAAGGGVMDRRPAAPMLRGPSALASSDSLASIRGPSSSSSVGKPAVALVKKQHAPLAALSQDVIGKTVQGQLPRIRACYERVIKHDPNARGRIVMSWNIAADGGVSGVEVTSDAIGSEQFAGCATRSVKKWRFPEGTGVVAVSYPFLMAPRSY